MRLIIFITFLLFAIYAQAAENFLIFEASTKNEDWFNKATQSILDVRNFIRDTYVTHDCQTVRLGKLIHRV